MVLTKEDTAVQLLLDHVEKEKSHIKRLRPSIYMTPRILRNCNPNSFDPRVVSIGPLHREDENLKAFEGDKARYLENLLKRSIGDQPKDILKLCVQKVYASMERIKACYVLSKWPSDAAIVNMMIMDACFILEFLFMFRERDQNMEGVLLYHNVLYDLVLLENQIPFFILEEIFQCTLKKCHSDDTVFKLIHPFLVAVNVFKATIVDNISFKENHHILSLLHQCYKPPVNIEKGEFYSKIPSVSDLDRAGVSFKSNENATWVMGMEVKVNRFQCFFGSWSKPTIRLPVLKVHDQTDLILRNLIAYEQSGSNDTYVTSYAFVLDRLVDTQEDVAKLVDSGVLDNYMGSNEEVANFINSICKDVVGAHFFYGDQWKTLNKYYEGYWPKNIAKFRRIYFSSPWTTIALVTAIILFALTVVQTIYTILSNKQIFIVEYMAEEFVRFTELNGNVGDQVK